MSGLGVIVLVCLFVGVQIQPIATIDDDSATWEHSAYNCSIYGDPHETDWAQQDLTLALPCPYVVTRLSLHAVLGQQWPQIDVEVTASNSAVFINGRYYVTIVCVRITYWYSVVNNFLVSFYVGRYDDGPEWIGNEGETQPGFVQVKYKVTDRKATLLLYNEAGAGRILLLKVVVRLPIRAQGNLQELKPMLVVWVKPDHLTYDNNIKVPSTLCSTVNDTDSVATDEKNFYVNKWELGIYYILEELGPFTFPDTDPFCVPLKTTFKSCKYPNCFRVLKPRFLKKCFGPKSDLNVLEVLDECLKANCYEADIDMACI
ncbi:hypothetical protein ACOMHN_059268 [Nucella lapillus]